jgi:hypothetical protein
MKKNYIVYQAYGSIDILNEALYSMLSFYRIHGLDQKEIQLVIYTDHPAHFESVLGNDKITCRVIDADRIKQWRGAIDFVHRVKIEVLIDFTQHFDHENVLYLDSDIYFTQSVLPIFERISEGALYMHEEEGALDKSKFPLILKMGKFIQSHATVLRARGFDIPSNTKTWNAGAIGFNASKKHILSKVLCFTDGFYTLYPKHIAEQFGFSFYLGKEGQVYTAQRELFHYWSFKEFRGVLKDFFEHHRASELNTMLKELDLISPITLGEPKRAYDHMHWFPKAFRKLKKNRWTMPAYRYWESNLKS